MSSLPTLLGSTIGDAANAIGFAAANSIGAGAQLVLHRLLANRLDEGRRVFLAEVAGANRPIRSVHEQDEFVAILYAYQEATMSGAAVLNLRLLARVVGGQHDSKGLYASEFLQFRNILVPLSREEVIHLGQLLRCWRAELLADGSFASGLSDTEFDPVETFNRAKKGLPKDARRELAQEKKQKIREAIRHSLLPSVYKSDAEFDAGSLALLRTGLVVSEAMGWSGVPSLLPSPKLFQLEALAKLEDLAAQARSAG